MKILQWLCSHSYRYSHRNGDVHLYVCTKCGKVSSNPVDG